MAVGVEWTVPACRVIISVEMEKDIVSKLNAELAEPITSERQVVYILVELRKLLELNGALNDYWTLSLCCDWAVHPKLNRSTAQIIVSLFDEYETRYRQKNAGVLQAELPELLAFVEHMTFRDEIVRSCERYGVSTDAFSNDDSWRSFLVHYTEVVRDCPFEARGDNTRYVEKVTAHAVAEATAQVILPGRQFGIQWNWYLKGEDRFNYVLSLF